jgi:4-amino-4-deoxy-L-arabinose transferase-like glycosyltransferase
MADNRERFLKWALAACIAVMFLGLGNNRALWDPDEGRYAEMAREILVLHDWVTPHLNNLLYFEKPMMYMWLEAISFTAFGISERAAHLVSMLCALGGVFLVGLMAKRLWGLKAGLIASLCLMTSIEYFVLSSSIDINMTLTLFITSAFVFFWLGHTEGKTRYFVLFWASMACATLTKGPIGIILPMGAIVFYILITRQFTLIRQMRPVAGILIYLAITLPWFVLVSLRNPDFFSFFFVNQNLQRYTAWDEHNQPFYFFLMVILVGSLPWTFLLPSAMIKIWKERKSHDILFITIWFILILAFFTPSHSKLATYVLPCFPPMALMVGYAFHDEPVKGGAPLYLVGFIWGLIGLALMILPPMVSFGFAQISVKELGPLMHAGPWIGAIITLGVVAGIWVGTAYESMAGIVIIGITVMITTLSFSPQWDSMRSTKSLVQDLPANARLCAYRKYYPSSSFYVQRQVSLVDYTGELEFGVKRNLEKEYVLTIDELSKLMASYKKTYCLTPVRNLPALRKKIPGIVVVRQSGNLCLLNIP